MWADRCPGPVSRREFLRAGSLTLGGLCLPELLAARESAGTPSSDTSVILLNLHGGPSQFETFDLKPDIPSEYRSVFAPIPTNVPGMEICELLPNLATLADKFALVRSLHHTMSAHSDGAIEVMTGKTPTRPDPTSQSRSEHPDFGMVTSKLRGMHPSALPQYTCVPSAHYATRPAYLGLGHSPFVVSDPSRENYSPPVLAVGPNDVGFGHRRRLLEEFDRLRRDLDASGTLGAMDRYREHAVNMLTSSSVAAAFDVRKEDPRLRDRYGRHVWGQSCLLARRLAEAGVGVVSIYVNTPERGDEFTNWDDHPGNAGRPGHFGKYLQIRLPYLDQSLGTLIADIYQRGLDRKIMVVVMGEFGRTPKLRKGPPDGSIGRDHWPQAYSALLAGGGLRTGQVVGATSSKCEYPKERPLTPKDLFATVYRHLGIDPSRTFDDFSGRPVHILSEGEPIRELVG